jgi:glutamate dehydrogenase
MVTPTTNGTTPNPPHHKLLDTVVRTPGRQPSPQPTLLGMPGSTHSNNSRVLYEEGPGYVAPKFEGKEHQKEEGKYPRDLVRILCHRH